MDEGLSDFLNIVYAVLFGLLMAELVTRSMDAKSRGRR